MGAEQSELIRRIAGVIGHELRNPMAVINNSAYFVRSKLGSAGLDPKVEKHLKIIESEIARADHMISDILFFTRPCQAALETKNIDQVIETALAATETPTPCKIEFKPGAKGVSAPLDVRLLTSALGRLIENACDAMEGKGTIHVRTGIEGQDV
jgi:signal transduction histidine kinase